MDKTPCAIEIIKTSDISKGKENRINEFQLLTFKVYIDDKGNQITNRDKIIGNREIESINQRIQEGEGKLAEKREFVEQLDKERKKKASKELSTFERKLNQRAQRDYGESELEDFLFTTAEKGFEVEIKRLEKECSAVEFGSSEEYEKVKRAIDIDKRRIESTIVRIDAYRKRVQKIPIIARTARIEPNKSIIKGTINTFINTIKSEFQLLELTKIRCIESTGFFCELSEEYFNTEYNEQRKQTTPSSAGVC
jgi:hypothetical protein